MPHPLRRTFAAVRLGEQISIISRLWIICPVLSEEKQAAANCSAGAAAWRKQPSFFSESDFGEDVVQAEARRPGGSKFFTYRVTRVQVET